MPAERWQEEENIDPDEEVIEMVPTNNNSRPANSEDTFLATFTQNLPTNSELTNNGGEFLRSMFGSMRNGWSTPLQLAANRSRIAHFIIHDLQPNYNGNLLTYFQ